jgi:D-lactate dehydrogenase
VTQAKPPDTLPPPALAQLRALLPPERLLTDPADCLAYGYDNSRRLALPQGVAFARDAEEIAALVGICRSCGIPLVARGRGTNTTGASVPIAGGLVLTLERMQRILEIVPGDRRLVCEAGALNADVQTAAARHGLFWAPDPTSAAYSTVGGNLACNAGGPRAVKYGTARDNVLGLQAVAGNGALIRTGANTSKSAVGYDLTRLLVGSEGTLALITQATLRLLPLPQATRTLRAVYRDVESAAAAVARLMAQPETPSALEFFDGDAVQLAQSYRDCGLPADAGALLLIDVDGRTDQMPAALDAIAAAAAGSGLVELHTASGREEAQRLWAARKALSPALRKLAPKKVNEDVAVPVSRLTELVHGITALGARHALRIVCFGHAGNGNLHVNLLANPDDPRQMRAIEACLEDVFRLVLTLGGTLSGEHGVGIDKRAFVGWEIAAPALDLMRGLKQVFDPAGILNPGKTLPGI